MESLPYFPGLGPNEPGPLSRFIPPLEQGTVSAWLMQHFQSAEPTSGKPSSWLLDPFGFAPQLPLEAARAGYRILVTVNNPITRFLIEMAANPPSESDFKAALADLAVSKRGEERLEAHLRSLYLTQCENCNHEVEAQSFLWRKGEDAPYARIYECKDCGDSGERLVSQADIDRVHKIAATDALHRSRALERVVTLNDDHRFYAEEAIQYYLARPLYSLTTILNRLDTLNLLPERRRALMALILVACDAGNTLWGVPSERSRPKQLYMPGQFREHNVWMMLERGLDLWSGTASGVPCVAWPNKVPDSGGICIYDGRLKDLAHEVKKEIPIAAVIGSLPRPNQAFWTLSALWAGWLWGRTAVEPYKIALRRRRYDWAWNATALNSAFLHLFDLLALGTPFFGLLPEAEPSFLTSALTAASAAGFDLKGLALRSEHDPIQMVWERGENLKRQAASPEAGVICTAIETHLKERGEPASYLHVLTAAVIALEEAHALKQPDQDFDVALRSTHAAVQSILTEDERFVHHTTGENVETGLWGLGQLPVIESLSDRAEIAVVNFLQKNPECIFLDIENDLNPRFPGLLTPSKGIIYAILNSYAERDGARWKIRPEDAASARRRDIEKMEELITSIAKRLKYKTRRQDKFLTWEENGRVERAFCLLASALAGRALAENPHPDSPKVLVIPGGRAALLAYKEQRDPSLAHKLQNCQILKYRLVRSLAEVPILTRETFDEQLASDPIEQARGQLMMF